MTASALMSTTPRAWRRTLWGLQILLAVFFLMAGVYKATQSLEGLTAAMPASFSDLPGWLVRFIGWCEIAGALGLIVPAATRILPQLTAVAALGLATVMVLATGFHLIHGEPAAIQPFVAAVAGLVAWGRLHKAPIAPRYDWHLRNGSGMPVPIFEIDRPRTHG